MSTWLLPSSATTFISSYCVMSAREKFAKAAQTVLGRTRKSLQINTSHSASTSSRPFFEASPILPRLYLSGLKTAINVGELDRLKVTHIVTVMERPVTYFSESQSIKRRTLLHISIADAGSEDLLQHLDCTTSFIQNALNSEDSVVLVSFPPLYHNFTTPNVLLCVKSRFIVQWELAEVPQLSQRTSFPWLQKKINR